MIEERVRFARRRFGHYDLIDFVAVLLGYAISGERTLEAFYERVHPFAAQFMALFGQERLSHRSTLSRFLAALGQGPVEALRTVFLKDRHFLVFCEALVILGKSAALSSKLLRRGGKDANHCAAPTSRGARNQFNKRGSRRSACAGDLTQANVDIPKKKSL